MPDTHPTDRQDVGHRQPWWLRASFAVVAAVTLAACAADASSESQGTVTQHEEVTPGTARVCSWNVRRLGHKFNGHVKDVAKAGAIIEDHCDVIAVQEVMQTAGGVTPGYDALLTTLGAGWKGIVTSRPRPDTTSPNSERYAFFYRTTAASLCDGWAGAQYLKDDEDVFLREPAWTCLKVNVHARELILVGYHALYGSLADRKREVASLDGDLDGDGLRSDVVRSIRATRPGADVVIVGDFNLKPTELRTILPTYKDVTHGAGSTINATDAVTDNLYDHVLMAPDERLATEIAPAEVLDVRSVALGASYFETISDHLPIRFVLGHPTTPPPPVDPPTPPPPVDPPTPPPPVDPPTPPPPVDPPTPPVDPPTPPPVPTGSIELR